MHDSESAISEDLQRKNEELMRTCAINADLQQRNEQLESESVIMKDLQLRYTELETRHAATHVELDARRECIECEEWRRLLSAMEERLASSESELKVLGRLHCKDFFQDSHEIGKVDVRMDTCS